MARRTEALEVKITLPVHTWGHTGLSISKAIQFCEEINKRKDTPIQHKVLYNFCIDVLSSAQSNDGKLTSVTYFIGAVIIGVKFKNENNKQKFVQDVENCCSANATLNNLLKHRHILIEVSK